MQEPRRIWWARPRKLCAMERPGGGGRSHRPDRRAAEIEWLKDAGVVTIISIMPTRQGLEDYKAAGLNAVHVPVEDETYDDLLEAVKVVARETRKKGAVAVCGNRYTHFVAAICAKHIEEHRNIYIDEALDAAIAAGLTVTPEVAELLEVDPEWIEDVLLQAA